MTDYEFQQDELLALASIYDENIFEATSDGTEGRFCAHLDLPNPFLIKTTSGGIKKNLCFIDTWIFKHLTDWFSFCWM